MGEVITGFGQEVGLCYWDGSTWQKVEAESLSQNAQLKYYDGAAWQNVQQEQLLGFEAIAEEAVIDSNLDAGADTVYGTAVGSGKILKITVASFQYTGTAPTYLLLVANDIATQVVLKAVYSVTSGQWYTWTGEVYLQEGDEIAVEVSGATAGDDIRLRYAGIRMDAP